MTLLENLKEERYNKIMKAKSLFSRGVNLVKRYAIFISYWIGVTLLSLGLYIANNNNLPALLIPIGAGALIYSIGLIISRN